VEGGEEGEGKGEGKGRGGEGRGGLAPSWGVWIRQWLSCSSGTLVSDNIKLKWVFAGVLEKGDI